MGQKSGSVKEPAKQVVKEIRRATRRQFSAEEKIRIVLTGLRGEDSIAELCRREGIGREPLLPLVEVILGSWQETPGRRHRAGGDLGRGQGSASGGQRVERGCCRADTRKPAAQKKHDRGWGRRRMRYAAAEKLEIIRLVEQSPLPVRHTLAKLGIPRATFYRWYDRHSRGGPAALNDRPPALAASGPAFPMAYANASSSWRSTSRRSHRASWRCALPTARAIS